MGFAAGFQAGSSAVSRGIEMGRSMKRQKREDEEYERQKEARESYKQIQQSYYKGEGDFAGVLETPAPVEPQTPTPAPQQMGVVQTYPVEQTAPGVQPPAATTTPVTPRMGLQPPAAAPVQPAGVQQPQPAPQRRAMTQPERDQLYFKKLGEWAQTHLDPEKATAYMRDLEQLKEMDYNRKRLDAFRAAAGGDARGLEAMGQLTGMALGGKGSLIDSSEAVFDPEKGWSNVKVINPKTGKAKVVNLSHDDLIEDFGATDPASMLQIRMARAKEARAGRQEGREDRLLTLRENADVREGEKMGILRNEDARADKLADAKIKAIDADIANNKALNGIRWASLNVEKQKLELAKLEHSDAEKAKDISSRQALYLSSYGFPGKLDPNSPNYEQDLRRAEAGKQLAGLATTIYAISADGVKPGERNAIHAETDLFIRQLGSDTIDREKLKDNGDGTYSYGRIKVPASLVQEGASKTPGVTVPQAKGGDKPRGVQVPGRPFYNKSPSELERLSKRPKGVSAAEQRDALEELEKRKGESRMGAF